MATLDDLRSLGFTVGISSTGQDGVDVYSLKLPWLQMYVREDDQATIDSLADPVGFVEHQWQYEHPEGHAARQQLTNAGYKVIRPDPLVNLFDVSGPIEARGLSTDALVSQTPTLTGGVKSAAAWVELRMIRDRWLAQTDYIEVFINNGAMMSHLPPAIQSDITANSGAWLTWRQALRGLPAVADLDPVAAVRDAPHASNEEPWPSEWPQPPSAPVIHLT